MHHTFPGVTFNILHRTQLNETKRKYVRVYPVLNTTRMFSTGTHAVQKLRPTKNGKGIYKLIVYPYFGMLFLPGLYDASGKVYTLDIYVTCLDIM